MAPSGFTKGTYIIRCEGDPSIVLSTLPKNTSLHGRTQNPGFSSKPVCAAAKYSEDKLKSQKWILEPVEGEQDTYLIKAGIDETLILTLDKGYSPSFSKKDATFGIGVAVVSIEDFERDVKDSSEKAISQWVIESTGNETKLFSKFEFQDKKNPGVRIKVALEVANTINENLKDKAPWAVECWPLNGSLGKIQSWIITEEVQQHWINV